MSPKVDKTSSAPSLIRAFQKLHEVFHSLMALRPWTIVHESIILGVRHPENGEVYYAYFMGELGEVLGFNLYRGEEIASWRYALDLMAEDLFTETEVLSHTFYQLTASKKTGLASEITELHRAAAITVPRGKAGYLEPISYRGGYTPVLMDETAMAEVAPLIPGYQYLLEQLAGGQMEDPETLDDRDECFVAESGEGGQWRETIRPLPEPNPAHLFGIVPPDATPWFGIKMLPKGKEAMLLHGQLLPMPVKNEAGIGIFPLLLLCIGVDSGLILGMRMLDADSWKEAAVPSVLETLKGMKALPPAVHVADERMLPLATACTGLLDLPLLFNHAASKLLDEIFDSLGQQFGM